MSEVKRNNPELPRSGSEPERMPRYSSAKRTLLLWLFLLSLVIAWMMFFQNRDGVARQRTELTQSEFEEYLEKGQVKSVSIEEQTSGDILILEGEYVKDAAAAQKKTLTPTDLSPFKTMVVYTPRLDELVNKYCPTVKVSISNGFWSNIWLSVLPIVLMIVIIYFFSNRVFRAAGGNMMTFGKSRARMVLPGPDKVTLKDVAGIEEAKSEMQEIVDYLKDPRKYRRLGGKIPRGVLMVGPPGTGKTLLARAIAGEAEVPFFSVSGSDFDEMFVGVGTSRVRDMFEEGKKHAPCLIFIDELDAIGRSRYGINESGHHEQTLNSLLVEMDGFEANSGVIVLAATNRPDVLDKALLRPGRFDRQITIDLPDLRGRLGILQIHADKICLDPNVDLRVIARGTAGFSGADLANLINEAALLATRTGKDKVGLPELEEARDKVCWGKERRSRRISDKERKLIAYHEAGHALVNILCENTKPLHKITIIPRGISYLGATMQLPEQDRYTIEYSELLDDMAVCMGGRIAEELVFKEYSSGASEDIRQATATARRMVASYGMSKLGPLNYANSHGMSFLGHELTNGETNSPETAREVDLEIRALVVGAEERVRKLLTENFGKLETLAQALLEKETMNAEEVYELLGMEMPQSKADNDDLEDIREQKGTPAEAESGSQQGGQECGSPNCPGTVGKAEGN
ncbi:MAG: ATP-dependent zinc metalloprotease FtsH [Victivallales bacterium]|nr:ATP-dependent zinc metalloprotease FtsH [Victivallales bacterium]